ncbi:M24 family metallopeptidase [Hydrogenothermus marinus]|uniref:Xaa-Pro aminopeptidase/Xaa-Pro dipeptidase n=1 Tax=Hydrogenothermus marinus TaxID=133270 RepID=A0A3M0BMS4_9AQUI|nr:aminopeptidase P family protein [Hydrogenothermus marinus]RMA97774.1 Xaa-Pro aminopeptidase/Xaa-Pro dipeptidase [Hydrogenothermus marinus]
MANINKVFEKIKKEELDAFLFSSPANVFYLSRFKSSNAYVVLTDKEKYFFTDFRYFEGAKEKLKDWDVILLKQGLKELKEFLSQFNKIGFEKDKFTISFYEKFIENTDLKDKLIGYEGFLNEIRMIKTEEEINIIRKAVLKIDNVYKKILSHLHFDIVCRKTELDVRRQIINYIFEEGGTGESFPAIVASGKHSAIPHWETSNSPIERNTLLLIDMGMIYEGYCSDFTRTLAIGEVDEELKKIYEIVKEAHLAATEVIKAGIPIKEVDLAARKVIEKAGYGEYFIHSTGHGIGVEIHEEPRIYKNNEDILKENTVFTIEPGIYLPNKGGVRLENIVVCRKDKAEVLTTTPLDFVKI